MADILERLDNAPQPMGVGGARNQLAADAAAEIRQLRAAIDEAESELAQAAPIHTQLGLYRHRARMILRNVKGL